MASNGAANRPDFMHPPGENCFVCQDYSAIDSFAKANRLQNLWNIHGNGAAYIPRNRDEDVSNVTFDAKELMVQLEMISKDFNLSKQKQTALQSQVSEVAEVIAWDDSSAKTIKYHLIEIQVCLQKILSVRLPTPEEKSWYPIMRTLLMLDCPVLMFEVR